jgi:hypothetical protein
MPLPDEYNEDAGQRRHWHLEKNISIGHIFTTLTVASSLLIWGMQMNTRVTVLEAEVVHGQQADSRLEQQLKDSVTRIESAVVRIEAALRDKADKR